MGNNPQVVIKLLRTKGFVRIDLSTLYIHMP